MSITSTEIDVSRFNEGSANLVLDPARFTEYYEKSSWMCWAPVICLTYAITIAVVLISSRIDPILQMTNFMTWFILGQGALLQIHIVGFFYINMIWKHPTVHVAICSYLAAAIYISVALRSQIVLELSLGGEIFDSSYNSQLIHFFLVCGTFSLFIFALIVAWFSRVTRKVAGRCSLVILSVFNCAPITA